MSYRIYAVSDESEVCDQITQKWFRRVLIENVLPKDDDLKEQPLSTDDDKLELCIEFNVLQKCFIFALMINTII